MQFVLFQILILLFVSTLAAGQNSSDQSAIQLSEAIERTLENATHIRIAEADKEAAEAGSGLLSSGYMPVVNSSLSYTRSQFPQIIVPIRQQASFPPIDNELYDATVQADWKLFDFGESRAVRQKALALADAASINYELAKMETIESTTSAFVQLEQLKELRNVQMNRVGALKRNRDQLESLRREGRVADVDLLKIEDAILSAETIVISTENSIDRLLQILSDDLAFKGKLTVNDIITPVFKNDMLLNPDNRQLKKHHP